MGRTLSIRNLYEKSFEFMPFGGAWKDVLGKQVRSGMWIVYGFEKNGKTTFSLMLADYLSTLERVLYVSAEEGVEDTFADTCRKAGISIDNKTLHLLGYTPVESLLEKLKRHKAEKIVFIDNLFVYRGEITEETLIRMKRELEDTLFVFVAHEEKGDPYPSNALSCLKLSKVIFRVRGMAVDVSGRGGAGGTFVIDGHLASLYHGSSIITNSNKTDDDSKKTDCGA
jgi:hypothetical protein